MLTNVLRLVEWPPAKTGEPSAPLIVGIVNSDDMEQAFRKAVGKMPGGRTSTGRPIVIRKLSGADGIAQCSVIFIGGSDRKRIDTWVEAIGGQPILTIGESDRFMSARGMLGLMLKEDHVQVEVNLAAAQAAGLQISSRLLRVAAIRG